MKTPKWAKVATAWVLFGELALIFVLAPSVIVLSVVAGDWRGFVFWLAVSYLIFSYTSFSRPSAGKVQVTLTGPIARLLSAIPRRTDL